MAFQDHVQNSLITIHKRYQGQNITDKNICTQISIICIKQILKNLFRFKHQACAILLDRFKSE